MKWKLAKLFVLCSMLSLCSPETFAQPIKVSFKQADSLIKLSPKPVLIFFHTSWCRYCQAMKHSSFRNKSLVGLLNKHFYFISFDAESAEDILFNNQRYSYIPTGNKTGYHQLTEALAQIKGEIAYPSICILDASYNIIFQHSGILSAKELTNLLESVLY